METIYDVVIIGGGPAGLTAGLYASRARMSTLLIESMSVMSMIAMSEKVENYPGIDSVNGFDLVDKIKKQAVSFGLKTTDGIVDKITPAMSGGKETWRVFCAGEKFEALSVVVASGASAKKLEVPGEAEFTGRGVSYCATCDAAFFKNRTVAVVGGGNTAVEEAVFLTKFADKVILIHRRDSFRAAKIAQERARANEKIEFKLDAVVTGIYGEGKIEKISLKNVKTGSEEEMKADGVFVFVGWQPNTNFVKGVIDLDDDGRIKVDIGMRTSRKGVFAAGDCCTKTLYQVVTAVGDGATAAFAAIKHVETMGECLRHKHKENK